MDGGLLAHLPTYGDQLEERRFDDEVAGVMLFIPTEEAIERRRVHGVLAQEAMDLGSFLEARRWKFT